MAFSYTPEALAERAAALAPKLRERAPAASRARQLDPQAIKDFSDYGLWYLLKPRRHGGPELRYDVVLETANILARGDGSAAWVWAVTGVHDLFVAYYPEAAQREYWAEDGTLSASAFAPTGKVAPAPGGWTLTGRWGFCSGIDHARWLLLGAAAGMLSSNPLLPDIRYVMLPAGDVRIIDDWHVLGLRGTGSKSVACEGVFVPEHRMVAASDLVAGTSPGAKLDPNPLYRAPVWSLFPFAIAASAAGIAQGACESFIAEMRARESGFDHSPLARKPNIQMRLAEATALADAAHLLYRRSLRETIDVIMSGGTLSLDRRLRSRRDQTYGNVMARRAVEILLTAQGGRGLFENGPVQRAFRDLTAIQAHIVGGWDIVALNYGQVALGGAPDNPMF